MSTLAYFTKQKTTITYETALETAVNNSNENPGQRPKLKFTCLSSAQLQGASSLDLRAVHLFDKIHNINRTFHARVHTSLAHICTHFLVSRFNKHCELFQLCGLRNDKISVIANQK